MAAFNKENNNNFILLSLKYTGKPEGGGSHPSYCLRVSFLNFYSLIQLAKYLLSTIIVSQAEDTSVTQMNNNPVLIILLF